MHKIIRGKGTESKEDLEWTKQEDDLLVSQLYKSQSGINSEIPRAWKDVAMDMNVEALRLGLKTRFFHHKNVRNRWRSKFGQSCTVGNIENAEPCREPARAHKLTAFKDMLARLGARSFRGWPLSPPTRRDSNLSRPELPVQDADLLAVETSGVPTNGRVPEPALTPIPKTQPIDRTKPQTNDETAEGNKEGNTDGSASHKTEGNPGLLAFADGRGKRVARNLKKSWLL